MRWLKGSFLPGLVLCLAAVVAVAACSSTATGTAQPTFSGGPRLSFDRQTWDFGEVAPGKPLEAVFRFQNLGDKPLVIEKAYTRVVEGCCPTQPDVEAMKLSPGKESTLAVRFTMQKGMTGPHVFEVLVLSNDQVEPEAKLTIKALFVEE